MCSNLLVMASNLLAMASNCAGVVDPCCTQVFSKILMALSALLHRFRFIPVSQSLVAMQRRVCRVPRDPENEAELDVVVEGSLTGFKTCERTHPKRNVLCHLLEMASVSLVVICILVIASVEAQHVYIYI